MNEPELIDLIKKNKSSNFLDYIYLDYPWECDKEFENPTKDNCLQIFEMFFSSLLELYTISFIEITDKKYTILYLGAAHCISIFFLLDKYFSYRVVKGLKNVNLREMKKFKLEKLIEYNESCIDFNKQLI
jgi:hypothetical protein